MAGRAGRGAALAEALRKRNQEPGQQESVEPTAVITAPARGRASLLSALAAGSKSLEPQQLPQPGITHETAPTPSVPSGRASLLSLARGKTLIGKVTTPGEEPSPAVISQKLAELTVEENKERPPVIRKGDSGKPIKASANYVRLSCEPGKGYFEYEVKFSPDVDSKQMRFKLLNACHEKYGRVKNFDGVILYLPIKLSDSITVFTTPHPVDGSEVTIKIIYKKTRRLGDCTHFYNVLFNKIFKVLNFARMGRQHYNPAAAATIPQHKLEIWPGYVTAIDEYEGGIMLNINASHRVLRQLTCYDVIQEALSRNKESWKTAVQKDLIGACVLTRYNNKLYRVDDLDFNINPLSTFGNRTGGETSFQEYYMKQYDIKIKDCRQPMLISKQKDRAGPKPKSGEETKDTLICLVPELCHMTGLTDAMTQDFKIMKDIATYTRITPNQRQLALKKFIRSVKDNPEACKVLSDWGLQIEDSTVSFEARVVPGESIIFGGGKSVPAGPKSDWSSAACNNRVLSAVDITHWAVICTTRDSRVVQNFSECLKRVGQQMGIEVNNPQVIALPNDRTDTYVKALRENIKQPLQLVVTVCPTSRDDRYSAIKKICCSDQPIASQVINTRTISKEDKLRSVTQKIALQINCKLGGSLWAVKIPFEGLMVCGMDVYHDASRKGSSVTGFVASLNQPLTRWFSRTVFQTPGQEIVDGLKVCLVSALKKYYDVNGAFPERIVIYRDGVGDGQLKYATEWEIPQIMSCFSTVNASYSPKLTVVIVQKRINCRIFQELGGGYSNPPPGTVVDHTVTRRDWYDFFLVSQFSSQGTVTPTHYLVIHDGCQMKVDHIQRLTFKMTHMYYNWPGTVRVPAPCQYAHKLAYLVGQSVHKDASEKLCDRLFFL